MGKRRKKPDVAPLAAPGAAADGGLAEKPLFEPDAETTNEGKNARLAMLVNTTWLTLAIVRVERIEIGASGWRVIFRE